MAEPYFTTGSFAFLSELAANNRRDWFEANKVRYLATVRDPGLAFVADLAPRLAELSPHFVADPRPVGGSMMRIYRDTRFSKDKRPYKTGVGFHFRHEAGGAESAPGFYLHLEPGDSMLGGGVWRPAPPMLARLRDAIADDPSGWVRASRLEGFTLHGESLKRPPAGYDAASPVIEDLKRKDFAGGRPLADAEVTGGLVDAAVAGFAALMPLMSFLAEAIDLEV